MNELFKVNYDSDRITLSARELHGFLEIGTHFKDWFPRMCEYGFEEEKDFRSILSKSTGGRPSTDYEITLDMAKEIAMLHATRRGSWLDNISSSWKRNGTARRLLCSAP